MRSRSFFIIILSLFLALSGFASWSPAAVAEKDGSGLLKRAVVQVEQEQQTAESENRLNKAEIAALRKSAKAAKAEAARRVTKINAAIAVQEKELEKLVQEQQVLEQKSRRALLKLNELAGVVRTSTRDLSTILESSPVSGDFVGRLEPVRKILQETAYPGMGEIATIADLYFAEMRASAEIKRSQNSFVGLDGRRASGQIVRLGALSTIYQNDADKSCGYAVYGPENDALLAVSKPGWRVSKNLQKFIAQESQTVYLDFSGGDAVRRLALTPSSWERLRSGGILVWPILLVGFVALIFSLERFLFLSRVKSNTDKVMGKIIQLVAAGDFQSSLELLENKKGPVFRVLTAGLGARKMARDILENVLEEAILKELPRLEKFLPTLQVLAAIAPLLGLLGTVTGMINTFQVITVYGAGDPRMMSGGISEALITTKLGLTVAIPIILLHTWFARRVDVIIGDMEEKSISLSIALQRTKGEG
ncbi:MAG: MotA/TolQ/ExbB proton channel family protein [Deltaproteobacteria bacterium]|nr:MotA/TolQ/ExbB proton channel family protein [Candidatus Tharpella aukensis]